MFTTNPDNDPINGMVKIAAATAIADLASDALSLAGRTADIVSAFGVLDPNVEGETALRNFLAEADAPSALVTTIDQLIAMVAAFDAEEARLASEEDAS